MPRKPVRSPPELGWCGRGAEDGRSGCLVRLYPARVRCPSTSRGVPEACARRRPRSRPRPNGSAPGLANPPAGGAVGLDAPPTSARCDKRGTWGNRHHHRLKLGLWCRPGRRPGRLVGMFSAGARRRQFIISGPEARSTPSSSKSPMAGRTAHQSGATDALGGARVQAVPGTSRAHAQEYPPIMERGANGLGRERVAAAQR